MYLFSPLHGMQNLVEVKTRRASPAPRRAAPLFAFHGTKPRTQLRRVSVRDKEGIQTPPPLTTEKPLLPHAPPRPLLYYSRPVARVSTLCEKLLWVHHPNDDFVLRSQNDTKLLLILTSLLIPYSIPAHSLLLHFNITYGVGH